MINVMMVGLSVNEVIAWTNPCGTSSAASVCASGRENAMIGTITPLTFAELASYYDRTGGPVLYAGDAFGPLVGFSTGWLIFLARMTAYTGKTLTWDEGMGSQLDLSPESYAWNAAPPPAAAWTAS